MSKIHKKIKLTRSPWVFIFYFPDDESTELTAIKIELLNNYRRLGLTGSGIEGGTNDWYSLEQQQSYGLNIYRKPPRSRNYRCSRCNLSFSIQKELNYHVRHNCGRVHRCSVCQAVYKSLQSAKIHFKRMHGPTMRDIDVISEPDNSSTKKTSSTVLTA